MTNYNTYRPNTLRCAHCDGTIIQNYDAVYCIQCSRVPTTEKPAILKQEEESANWTKWDR